ncbi:uncharacterized protein LOC126739170 [Anthonomus grandis grandis]|uniref:uncharacterized protein LOC126739170 n=1 Tax=Anthonomus grandis grandis TaxID=2921223 RepID=UPI00216588A7|nr:uncharacterized protein LOC126739170 [Anthonomus grandis grandis]XP_050300686.1 uncharacterized protein LOC126739170 [Anthonomus grandis grandis]XP_050300687.1 uncharacterized protein LOC126739170 [Anthonomus grandis grandis]
METEELIKLVDGIYKNILDKFNPGARQMINAGKAYLKALHGAAAASRLYVDAISKLAKQAQQGTWGGSSDIGAALMKVVEVYKEIQDQQMNILKAFYVDLLVPLETNLEKDTKVVQSEQKRFLQQHKQRSETYSKAAAMMKKQRKKSRGSTKSGLAMDKELKNMQVLEEEKTKLDAFCEQSLKNAMTQERRRYGFVLERHCSLAKHYLSYHTYGSEAYTQNIEKWSDVAKTREYLPEAVENIFSNRIRQISVWQDEDLYSNPRSPNFEEDRMSLNSQLRKTKSMDASCLDIRSMAEVGSPVNTLSRAKSEYNLNSSNNTTHDNHTPTRRPKSMAVPPPPTWEAQLARALYAYLSSGENQLSFHEGDLIALIGDRNKGWQFGENLRTQCSGWFPLAYTEILIDDSLSSPTHRSEAGSSNQQHSNSSTTPTNIMSSSAGSGAQMPSGSNSLETPSRMFGDTLHLHRSSNNATKQIRRAIGSNNIPPPAAPAPVPTPSLPYQKSGSGMTQSQSTNFGTMKSAMTESGTATYQSSQYSAPGIKSSASAFNFSTTGAATGPYSTHPAPARERPTAGSGLPLHLQTKGGKIGGPVGNVSLHSSNDSGFSNDPPPQPEIDYSDDDSMAGQTKLANRTKQPKQKQPEDQLRPNQMNKTRSNPNKPPQTRHRLSNSHGNLVENHYLTSDEAEVSKVKVKRTKSFWKFGKNNSDTEILEGMSLWRHRDLVDPNEEAKKNKLNSQERIRKPSRDQSYDSDKTINNKDSAIKPVEKKDQAPPKVNKELNKNHGKRESFKEKSKNQKLSLPPRKESSDDQLIDDFEEDIYGQTCARSYRDQFIDDDEDGLVIKTVNRKSILQQYSDDLTAEESDSASEMTSDDPYDCIVVDDQKVRKRDGQFPNVAEIGKKLEKLSKSSKYSPNKDNNKENTLIRSSVREKNEINVRRSKSKEKDLIEYHQEQRRSFRTFGIDNENGEKDDSYYEQNRRQPEENIKQAGTKERRSKPSYESIDSEMNNRNRTMDTRDKDNKRSETKVNSTKNDKRNKYYDSTNDELSDVGDNRQFLPRTKLTKTNSNSSKYDENLTLMEYGETLQRRLKHPEYNSKYDEKSMQNGNMYGPWYDLWGLDASARK